MRRPLRNAGHNWRTWRTGSTEIFRVLGATYQIQLPPTRFDHPQLDLGTTDQRRRPHRETDGHTPRSRSQPRRQHDTGRGRLLGREELRGRRRLSRTPRDQTRAVGADAAPSCDSVCRDRPRRPRPPGRRRPTATGRRLCRRSVAPRTAPDRFVARPPSPHGGRVLSQFGPPSYGCGRRPSVTSTVTRRPSRTTVSGTVSPGAVSKAR